MAKIQGLPPLNRDGLNSNSMPTRNLEQRTASATRNKDKQSSLEQTDTTIFAPKELVSETKSAGVELSDIHISFSKDKDTNEIVIKIINSETNEVIRQIPPEELMRLKKRMEEIHGLLLNRKV